MSLLSLQSASLALGDAPLLAQAQLSIASGERIGLIGRNGTGKSTLLKVLAGWVPLDDGQRLVKPQLALSYVAQEPELNDEDTVFEAVNKGLKDLHRAMAQYSRGEGDLHQLQNQIEARDGWHWQQRVDETLTRLRLHGDQKIKHLSGGTRKRVALGQALVASPDLLLLDEPTNHLDLDSIFWLESLLRAFKGSIVVVTHDRAFLDQVATRIVELDRGVLSHYPGRFQAYQQAKEAALHAEEQAHARADKKLAEEEVWIRKGVEARRTRSVARVARLAQLRAARAARRDTLGQVKARVDSSTTSGKVVAELKDVSLSFDQTPIVKRFSATVLRGDKIGLIGPNGAGKTTLLKLMLGSLPPDSGKVKLGTNLQIAYFDQMREAIDPDATLEDFISPGSEWITIGSQRQHVKSYLGDFLFPPSRAHSPVRSLSGGERNRLLLARLFARPANVLVLDEPTNDLDIDTLEVLESLLQKHQGTVMVVSHDRTFLENVVTSIIAYEGDGQWREYEGGVEDWLLQSQRALAWNLPAPTSAETPRPKAKAASEVGQAIASPTPASPRKLSYKEQREWDALPSLIDTLEAEQAALNQSLADGHLYATDPKAAADKAARVMAIEEALLQALSRWADLETRATR